MLPDSSTQQTALEHLKVIRTLMERAHIYRAVSAPAAALGGLLALILAGYGFYENGIAYTRNFQWQPFLASWLVLLVFCTAVNFLLLFREAGNKGQPFVTDGLRMALRAVCPPLLAFGLTGMYMIVHMNETELASLLWIQGYGIALLATASFAPRSIIRLGHSFVWTGLILALLWMNNKGFSFALRPEAAASLFLGLTFGIYHLVYAVAVFLRKAPQT